MTEIAYGSLSARPEQKPEPEETLELGARDEGEDGRPQVLRPARHVAARDDAAAHRSTSTRSGRASALTAPRSAAGRASPSRTCSSCPTRRRRSSTRSWSSRRSRFVCEIADPLTLEPYSRRSAPASPRRPRRSWLESGIADAAYFGPEAEFFVFDSVSYSLETRARPLRDRLRRGPLERRRARTRIQAPREGGLLPGRTARHAVRPSHADGPAARAARRRVRVPSPRSCNGRPVRDRHALQDPDAHGRPGDALQVRRSQRGQGVREDGHVHAEAALRRQRLGDAYPPVPLEERRAADGRRGVRRTLRSRTRLHRRASSPTLRRCSPSALRPRTPTAVSCPATRLR